jgi:hypothetical protein
MSIIPVVLQQAPPINLPHGYVRTGPTTISKMEQYSPYLYGISQPISIENPFQKKLKTLLGIKDGITLTDLADKTILEDKLKKYQELNLLWQLAMRYPQVYREIMRM